MKFTATCNTCHTTLRFSTYDDRADWVGKHRVRTGHSITVGETA